MRGDARAAGPGPCCQGSRWPLRPAELEWHGEGTKGTVHEDSSRHSSHAASGRARRRRAAPSLLLALPIVVATVIACFSGAAEGRPHGEAPLSTFLRPQRGDTGARGQANGEGGDGANLALGPAPAHAPPRVAMHGPGDPHAAAAAAASEEAGEAVTLAGVLRVWAPFEGDDGAQRAFLVDTPHGDVRLLGWEAAWTHGDGSGGGSRGAAVAASGARVAASGKLLPGPVVPYLRVATLRLDSDSDVDLDSGLGLEEATGLDARGRPAARAHRRRRLSAASCNTCEGVEPGPGLSIIVLRPEFPPECPGVITLSGGCQEDEWRAVLCGPQDSSVANRQAECTWGHVTYDCNATVVTPRLTIPCSPLAQTQPGYCGDEWVTVRLPGWCGGV